MLFSLGFDDDHLHGGVWSLEFLAGLKVSRIND